MSSESPVSDMTIFSVITRMPDEPGAFLKAARIMRQYGANMARINYDRDIDTHMLFIDVSCRMQNAHAIKKELEAIGYLEKKVPEMSILAFDVYLPDRCGELFDLLDLLGRYNANITYVDFDNSGVNRDKVRMRLNISGHTDTDSLLKSLQRSYRIDILEYDDSGDNLDDTVFYIRFIQKLRRLTGIDAEDLLTDLLAETNHIAQELTALNRDTRQVFDAVTKMAERIAATRRHFFCDVETIPVSPKVVVHNVQMPTGSNVTVFETPDEYVMIDTGYGVYHSQIRAVFEKRFPDFFDKLKRIYISHADADHCGGCGHFSTAVTWMNPASLEVLHCSTRGFGSQLADSVLEKVYTRLSHILSEYCPPRRESIRLFADKSLGDCRGFTLIDAFEIGDIRFDVLQGKGGHVHGEMIFLAREHGLMFTGDCLVNLRDMSSDRIEYNKLADFLMTTVNVDSELAKAQRRNLLAMIAECDQPLRKLGKRMLVFGGHGPVSVLGKNGLERPANIVEERVSVAGDA